MTTRTEQLTLDVKSPTTRWKSYIREEKQKVLKFYLVIGNSLYQMCKKFSFELKQVLHWVQAQDQTQQSSSPWIMLKNWTILLWCLIGLTLSHQHWKHVKYTNLIYMCVILHKVHKYSLLSTYPFISTYPLLSTYIPIFYYFRHMHLTTDQNWI